MPYSGGSIRDLILNRGRIAAEGAQNSAAIWGGAAQGFAGIAGDYLGRRQVRKDDEAVQRAIQQASTPRQFVGPMQPGEAQPPDRQPDINAIMGTVPPERRGEVAKAHEAYQLTRQDGAFLELLQSGEPLDVKQAVSIYGPRKGLEIFNAYDSLKADKPDPAVIAKGLRVGGPAIQETAWPTTRAKFAQLGVELPERFDPELSQRLVDQFDPQKPAEAPKLDTRSIDVRLAEAAVSGDKATYDALITMERDKAAATRGPGTPENKIWITRDGKPAFVPESQVRVGDAPQKAGDGSVKPSTGAQKRALAFYNDAKQAADDADAIADEVGNAVRLKYAPNVLQSEEGQKYWQAIRSFSEARLRLRSGAAIPTHEIEKDAQTYFKQPGDTDEVLKQKKASRDRVLDGIRFEAGPAYDEYYGEPAPRMPATSTAAIQGAAGARVRVNSPADVDKLKPGTRFITPDGRTGTR